MKILSIFFTLIFSMGLSAQSSEIYESDSDSRSILERRSDKARENQEKRWSADGILKNRPSLGEKQEEQTVIDPQLNPREDFHQKEGTVD
jgi:hypothetical protein